MQIFDLVNHASEPSGFRAYAVRTGAGSVSGAATTAGTSGSGTPATTVTGAFITPQSLVAFPFAAGLVAGFWKGVQVLLPSSWGSSPWVALVIAFAIGSLISLISLSDARLQLGPRDKAIAFGIGILNCFYLFLAALGMALK